MKKINEMLEELAQLITDAQYESLTRDNYLVTINGKRFILNVELRRVTDEIDLKED